MTDEMAQATEGVSLLEGEKPLQDEPPMAAALARMTAMGLAPLEGIGATAASDAQVMAAAMDAFLAVYAERGIDLYAAQEEAILELTSGHHVILNTPTGSGKSLVATFAHFLAMATGKRSYYTCPIKALVSEKFFALCHEFGARNVGMLTGDASINRDAPIICCTAEVLANVSITDEAAQKPMVVIMDEFHYYGDAARGVAWQLPLLTLKRASFVLMSATLGDVADIAQGITEMTGAEVALVQSPVRPVPLDYHYSETPLTETLAELMSSGRSPIYVVHFTQRDAIESAQAALSTDFLTKEQKAQIKAAVGHFRFDSPFGKHMRRFIMHGMGVHHAGLLPKYRLLVEKLAQQGLLRIIMGTDTLGVGINVPIRTVLFTRLCKYDGTGTNILSVRDFKQISGRAGRKGFDDAGSVICQAPEHVIENLRAQRRVGDDAKALRKLVKKKPPQKGYVPWDKSTFERLISDPPEALVSRFVVDHHLLLNLLRGNSLGYRAFILLIGHCFERPKVKSQMRRRARTLFVALKNANLVRVQRNRLTGARVVVDSALGEDFSLTHTLSLFLLHVLEEMDPTSETYALDVLSVVESILEHPGAVIARQVDKRKKDALDAMRAEGIPYEERIEALEEIEHDKPLKEFLYDRFNHWSSQRPWVAGANVWPKSIAREMVENCTTFVEYVGLYGLERIEGVLLRYLTSVYRALLKNLPTEVATQLVDVIAYLRDTLSRVDASLKAEWSAMTDGSQASSHDAPAKSAAALHRQELDPKVLRARIRAQMHQLTRLLARQDYEGASVFIAASAVGDSDAGPDDEGHALFSAKALQETLQPFFAEYGTLSDHMGTRRPEHTHIIERSADTLAIQHTLFGADGPSLWALHADATLTHSSEDGGLRVHFTRIGP